MIYERIELGDGAYLDTYVAESKRLDVADALLVIPGGGYTNVCSDREGENIALAFTARGINSFVLTYRLGPENNFPSQLIDAARAMAHIRENADKYCINPNRIFAVGFSAGGHLAGTLATKHKLAEELLGLPENFARPTGVILSYPVVTALTDTHTWSFEHLLGKPYGEITDEERRTHSLEMNVTETTPPAFIWHTSTDSAVPVCGSLRLAEAYYRAGVPVEVHIFPRGPHGIALASKVTSATSPDFIQPRAEIWVDEACKWIEGVCT